MDIQLEQLKILAAVAHHGSIAGAAKALKRHHPNVLHALKTLEERTSLLLLNRAGYRTTLTEAGARFLAAAQKVLNAENELIQLASSLRHDFEPQVMIVYDGLLPHLPLLELAAEVQKTSPLTRVSLRADYLGGVEQIFDEYEATVMLTLLPNERPDVVYEALPPLTSCLVVSRNHPLARSQRSLSKLDLQEHTFLTVQGSDTRLAMTTESLRPRATFSLADFQAKKVALMTGMGFGWMPRHLIAEELRRKKLVLVHWERSSEHVFYPMLGIRRERAGGAASQHLCQLVRDLPNW